MRGINVTKLALLLGALLAIAFPAPTWAKSWPDHTVRLVVPYPPGGNADIVGRIVAEAMQNRLRQPFVVVNKAGAGGVIGGSFVAAAEPDGYTFLFSANGPILFAPELVEPRPYDWHKAFAPVSTVSLTPLVLLEHPSVPAKDLKGFLDYARSQGKKLIFASGGLGTTNHLFSELMQDRLKLNWTTVQYKGTAPAMNDLIGGHAQFGIDQVATAVPFVKGGIVRALAVTGEKRSPLLPDVPTLVELGHPDLTGYTFTALMAPAGTPKDIVAKVYANLDAVMKDPAVAEKIQKLGAEVGTMSPDLFEKFLERETTTWNPIVRKLNVGANK
jgi:tripartite-type tricarboxylate transporter receptor subunit TctC